jgi:hypothetical protein
MKSFIGFIIVILFVAIIVVVIVHPHHSAVTTVSSIHSISEIRVVTGNEFSVKLEDGRLVHAFLAINTPPEATKEVIKKLNAASKSYLKIEKLLDKSWTVDIIITECNGTMCQEQSLTAWLKKSKLAWE